MSQKLKNRKKALRKWSLGEYVGHVIWIAWNIKAPRFYTKHVIEIIYLDRWPPYSPMRWFDIRSKMKSELKINWIEKFSGQKFSCKNCQEFPKIIFTSYAMNIILKNLHSTTLPPNIYCKTTGFTQTSRFISFDEIKAKRGPSLKMSLFEKIDKNCSYLEK